MSKYCIAVLTRGYDNLYYYNKLIRRNLCINNNLSELESVKEEKVIEEEISELELEPVLEEVLDELKTDSSVQKKQPDAQNVKNENLKDEEHKE